MASRYSLTGNLIDPLVAGVTFGSARNLDDWPGAGYPRNANGGLGCPAACHSRKAPKATIASATNRRIMMRSCRRRWPATCPMAGGEVNPALWAAVCPPAGVSGSGPLAVQGRGARGAYPSRPALVETDGVPARYRPALPASASLPRVEPCPEAPWAARRAPNGVRGVRECLPGCPRPVGRRTGGFAGGEGDRFSLGGTGREWSA